MNTKPFYLSTTIISAVVSGVAQLLALIHVNISDLIPQITDAIGQQINATLAIAGVVGAIYGRFRAKTVVTLSAPSVPKSLLLVLAAGLAGCLLVSGCKTTNGVTSLDPTATAVLASIQTAASTLAQSGALPAGSKASGITSDVATIANALQTVNTGTGISPSAAAAVAASFKSNSSTTAYVTLGATVIDALVPAINALVNSGASKSSVQNVTNQVLANAPSTVAAAVATTAN